jgi:hypothetical protein
MLRTVEAVLLVEVSLKRNSISEHRRRLLIRLIHRRREVLRMPPANPDRLPPKTVIP